MIMRNQNNNNSQIQYFKLEGWENQKWMTAIPN